jgi:predicted TIM-barrel fold metal-dependent hydrolase
VQYRATLTQVNSDFAHLPNAGGLVSRRPPRRWLPAALVATGLLAFVVLAPWRQWFGLEGRPAEAPPATGYPDIPRIDVHVHVDPQLAVGAARMFTRHHVQIALNASGGAPGRGLTDSERAARATEGRIRPYCTMPFGRVGSPDFAAHVNDTLDRCRAQGAVGVKISKALGLGIEDEDGSLLRVDDPRLDVLFDGAAERGLPILIHTGDPQAFFRPPTPDNERYEELSAHPSWSFYGDRRPGEPWPSWESLFAQFEQRVRRHPEATFVGAHFGNAPEEPDRVAAMLDAHPRYVIEIGARIPEIGRHDAERMRKLFIKYQDRILFGTDLQMGTWGLALGSSGAEPDPPRRIPAFFAAHWRYLETRDRGFAHPTPIQGDWTIDGLGLPRAVLEKVYWRNAARVFNVPVEQHR